MISNEFIDKLRENLQRTLESGTEKAGPELAAVPADATTKDGNGVAVPTPKGIVTSEEEIEFHRVVQEICAKAGTDPALIIYRDTINYFNVSHRKPTLWFARFFGDTKRKSVVTWVPVEEAKALAQGFEVEAAPAVFGVSRVYIDAVAQVWAIKGVITRSLEILQNRKTEPATPGAEG